MINYLAKCSGDDCTSASAGDLSFFKIAEEGLVDGSSAPGTWATDGMMANGLTQDVTIPSSIAAGSYVLRHEIIALHSAGQANGAQSYPMVRVSQALPICRQRLTTCQCINLKVSGGGSSTPSGTPGTSLYSATDPGIVFDLYTAPLSYTIPGPSLAVSKRSAVPFKA